MRRSHLVPVLLIALQIVSSGCGNGNKAWVTGKLLKGGSKYVPPKDQLVNVTLVCLELHDASGNKVASSEPYWAEVDQANGTFAVPGNEGQGIPFGKYRVAITQKMTREAFNTASQRSKKTLDRETDMLSNRFGLGNSPIVRDVTSSCELAIDLDKPAD